MDARFYRNTTPRRPEVIVFKKDSTYFIKRVIGVPGDVVEGKDRNVLVNGKALLEPYIQHGAKRIADPGLYDFDPDNFGPIEVSVGKYFVMGDNRDISFDSRSPDFGMVDQSSIIGRAMYVFATDREGARIQ